MIASQTPLRRLSLSAFFAALILSGLAAVPAVAQQRCAVSPQRGQYLVNVHRQLGAERVQIVNEYRAREAWGQRNWRWSHTPQYRANQRRMQSLHQRFNWVRHNMNQAQAEYYGRSGGYVAAGGMSTGRTGSTTSSRSSTGPVRFLNQSAGTQRRGQGTSGGPNYTGLNLLNQRVSQ